MAEKIWIVLPWRFKLVAISAALLIYAMVGGIIYVEVQAQVKTPDQATAPEVILAKTVEELKDGEVLYAMQPEAFVVGADGKCWLDPTAPVSPISTVVKVTRDRSGYHVTIVQNQEVRWVRSKIDMKDKRLVPVKTLVILPPEKEKK